MTLKKYIFKNLWLQVVISLIIGVSVGLILGDDVGVGVEDESLDFVTSYLKIPASIFLSLIYMIIVPLIFSSIVVAINSLGTTEKLKTLGLGVASYFVITTTIAILVAVFLASLIAPGNILDISALQESYNLSDKDIEINEGFSLEDIPNTISNIIPRNPITSYLEGQMLSILIFALIIGLSMTAIPKESAKPLLDILESIQKNNIADSIVFHEDCTVCSFWFDCWHGLQNRFRVNGRFGNIHGNGCTRSWNYVISVCFNLKVCSKKTNTFNILEIS